MIYANDTLGPAQFPLLSSNSLSCFQTHGDAYLQIIEFPEGVQLVPAPQALKTRPRWVQVVNPVPSQASAPRSVLSLQVPTTSPFVRGAAETDATRPTRTKMKARILILKDTLVYEGLSFGSVFGTLDWRLVWMIWWRKIGNIQGLIYLSKRRGHVELERACTPEHWICLISP